MLEGFVSHDIATEYQPVEVEKFSSRGSDQPRLLESRNFFCSLYFIIMSWMIDTKLIHLFVNKSEFTCPSKYYIQLTIAKICNEVMKYARM